MSKRSPALVEAGIGLILSAFFAFSYLKGASPVDTVSQKTYDLFARLTGPAPLSA